MCPNKIYKKISNPLEFRNLFVKLKELGKSENDFPSIWRKLFRQISNVGKLSKCQKKAKNCEKTLVSFWWILSYWDTSYFIFVLPQIFRGASNSKRMGCCRNISRDFKHNPLTSFSVICTVLPGRLPLTKEKFKSIHLTQKKNPWKFVNSTNHPSIWRISHVKKFVKKSSIILEIS